MAVASTLGCGLIASSPLALLGPRPSRETVTVLRGRALGCGLITSSPLAPPLARDLVRETVSVLRGRALGCGLIASSPLAPPVISAGDCYSPARHRDLRESITPRRHELVYIRSPWVWASR